MVLGGLARWFTRRRTGSRLRQAVVPDRTRHGRARNLSWHGVTGTWIALGLLALAASGLTWSEHAGSRIGDIRHSFDWNSRVIDSSLGGSEAEPERHHAASGSASDAELARGIGIDGVLATALAQGLRAPLDTSPPADGASAWSVAENKRSAPTQYDAVTVDPHDGSVVERWTSPSGRSWPS